MALRRSESLSDLIPGVLAGWKHKLDSPIHEVVRLWESIVGQDVARHASPVSLRRGVLLVSVESAVWAAELSAFRSEEIKKAVNDALGAPVIQRVRFSSRDSSGRVKSEGESHGQERDKI